MDSHHRPAVAATDDDNIIGSLEFVVHNASNLIEIDRRGNGK